MAMILMPVTMSSVSGAIHVLHLEDSALDAELIRDRLVSGGFECDIHIAKSRDQFESALASKDFDLIICDYSIPGYDGAAALRLAISLHPAVPVIMISGGLSEYEAVDCLHLGATDYVLKQSLVRLPTAVARALTQATEKKLRIQAENRFRSLMESAPDAMVIVDSKGAIILVNSQAEALFGYDRAELVGQSVEMLMPQRFRHGHKRLIKSFVDSRSTRKIALPTQLLGLRRDGVEIPVEIMLSPLEQLDGNLTIAGIRDLTERRKLELQLSRVQRMESIGAFAGKIAHDLNNAFTPALMSLELMKLQAQGDSELIGAIEAGAIHGADMLKQLLVFSKGAYVEPELLDPQELLEGVEEFIRLTFPKNIELKTEFAKALKPIWGDATQIRQVLMNLCGNSRDAMPDGGRLLVRAEMIELGEDYANFIPEGKPGEYLFMRVSDTGAGMPQHVLDRIFEPFYSTKPQGKGTGLGLSIVAGIVKSHLGFVNIYSAPGKGSTFSVFIPCASPDTERSAAKVIDLPPLDGRGDLILVVDDAEEICVAAKTVLTALNFRVLTAEDSEYAIKQVKGHREELKAVITDLHMPNKDGGEFAQELMETMPSAAIILMSGNFASSKVQELKEIGVRAFLEKPFTQDMLTSALRSVLER